MSFGGPIRSSLSWRSTAFAQRTVAHLIERCQQLANLFMDEVRLGNHQETRFEWTNYRRPLSVSVPRVGRDAGADKINELRKVAVIANKSADVVYADLKILFGVFLRR